MPILRTASIALVCALVALVGGLWLGGHPESLPGPVREAFVSEDRATRAEILEHIDDIYYKKVNRKRLEDGSLAGMVRELNDPFSAYLNPEQTKAFNESVSGRFQGIGVTVAEDERGLKVSDVLPKSPAKRSGILEGDVIVAVEGNSIASLPTRVSTARIRGRPGTSVRLTVLTPSAKRRRNLRVKRAALRIPVVDGRLSRRGGSPVAVVRLRSFSEGSHGLLAQEIRRLQKRGARGLVLDLRGNGGGLLDEAIRVSGLFVQKGLIVSTKGRASPERKFEAPGGATAAKIPMVVLVDRGSASASEIVAGALRDRGRAQVVGTRTFGKGVFQTAERLENGGTLELVTGRYYLPKGEPVSRKGLKPDVAARDRPRTPRDEALPVALRELEPR